MKISLLLHECHDLFYRASWLNKKKKFIFILKIKRGDSKAREPKTSFSKFWISPHLDFSLKMKRVIEISPRELYGAVSIQKLLIMGTSFNFPF